MSESAHLEPVTYVLRLYRPGESFAQSSPYCASATVQCMGGIAYISGLCGTMNRRHYLDIKSALRSEGMEAIVMSRREKIKVIPL